MSDDSANLDHLPDGHPLRAAARHRELLRQQEETVARHQDNPAVQQWLQQFYGDGKGFLQSFAENRTRSLSSGRRVYEQERADAREIRREGKQRLWEIQQRKLWELQVRWRAGEATAADAQVRTTKDFENWGRRIKKCRWLPRITAAEVEEYLRHLLSPECYDADPRHARPHDWQDYDTFRRYLELQADGHGPEQLRRETLRQPPSGNALADMSRLLAGFFLAYPSWYAWCDRRAGHPNPVLTLPNLRGFDNAPGSYERNEDEPDEDQPSVFRPTPTLPAPPTGPPLLAFDQFAALTATLMRAVETPELQRYHQACQPQPAEPQPDPETADLENRLNEVGHEAGRQLAEMPERHPIAAAADWREALYSTWLNRRKQLLAVAVREAFTKYETPRERPHPF
jgi:hypothetical protein